MHHVICRFLRPKTAADYIKEISKNVSTVKAKRDDYTELTVENYDLNLHEAVNTMLDAVLDYDEIFRTAATADELSYLPKVDYGRKENPGVYRILMSKFGKFQENYKKVITLEKLNTAPNLSALITSIKNINDRLATEAIQLRQANSQLQPFDKSLLDDRPTKIAKDGDEQDSGYKRGTVRSAVINGAPKHSVTFGSVTHIDPNRQEATNDNSSDDNNTTHDSYDDDDSADQDTQEEMTPDSDNDQDTYGSNPSRTLAEDLDRLLVLTGRTAHPSMQSTTANTNKYQHAGGNQQRSGNNHHNKHQNQQRTTSNVDRKSSNHPPLPSIDYTAGPRICFALFKHGVCSEGKDCQYSHDPADLRRYGKAIHAYVDSLPSMKNA